MRNRLNYPDPELRGQHVRLTAMRTDHADALVEAAADGKLWQLWFTSVPDAAGTQRYIERALSGHADGSMLPFVVCDLSTGRILGSTRYCNIDAQTPRLEIGYTWYRASAQRSAVNTECKRLLLAHAFESLRVVAVEFRTHVMNHRSRSAIERLGARCDGILRQHQRLADGTMRDTVVYSILDHEWPVVRRHLDFLLGKS